MLFIFILFLFIHIHIHWALISCETNNNYVKVFIINSQHYKHYVVDKFEKNYWTNINVNGKFQFAQKKTDHITNTM